MDCVISRKGDTAEDSKWSVSPYPAALPSLACFVVRITAGLEQFHTALGLDGYANNNVKT